MAPFVFLGSAYDIQLKEMYTTYSTKDLLIKHSILNALTGSSAADTAPLKKMLAKYIDQQVMDRITSYNVCYTKLLRRIIEIFVNLSIPTYLVKPLII